MKIELKENVLIVTREKGDPAYPPMGRNGRGSPESRLLYHIQKALNAKGHDLIKKRMWKDGHLVDDNQLYLRTRNSKSPKPHIYIYNPSWQVHDAARDLMEHGTTTLAVERDVFKGGFSG